MGCSLDTYRARIGRFGGTSRRIRKIENQKSMIGKVFFSTRKMGVLFFGMWVVILAIALKSAETSIHQEYISDHPIQSKEQYHYAYKYPYRLSARKLNKEVHARNGNQVNRGKQISICYWNKGSSYMVNKNEDIRQIIDKYKPMVLG